MGLAACQMEKKGISTEKGELNRAIRKSNRLIKEIRAQIGNLKEWIAGLLAAWETCLLYTSKAFLPMIPVARWLRATKI